MIIVRLEPGAISKLAKYSR